MLVYLCTCRHYTEKKFEFCLSLVINSACLSSGLIGSYATPFPWFSWPYHNLRTPFLSDNNVDSKWDLSQLLQCTIQTQWREPWVSVNQFALYLWSVPTKIPTRTNHDYCPHELFSSDNFSSIKDVKVSKNFLLKQPSTFQIIKRFLLYKICLDEEEILCVCV